MIRIFVRMGARRTFEEIPNGPFPITAAQLDDARARFAEQVAAAPGVFGIALASATTAREILEAVVPHLEPFDRLSLAYAVTATAIRTEVAS